MIKFIKEILAKYKLGLFVNKHRSVLTIFILIAGILTVFFYAGKSTVTLSPEKSLPPKTVTGFIANEQVMLNGHSWADIEKLDLSLAEQRVVKARILRVILESSLFSGSPIIEPSEDIAEYVLSVDRLYSDKDNKDIPVFFILKIADLAKNNTPDFMINSYRDTVKEKLKEIGIIQ
jgi:hypothetical protein